jgi:hypothetical protein
VLLASTATVAVVAIVFAAASLVVSVWQATLKGWEFRHSRTARITVDPGEIHAGPEHWEVEVWLTNVGPSHARRVRVWLEDESGAELCPPHLLPRPLISGDASTAVKLRVPRNGRSVLIARPVRRWRDGRDVSLPKDVSDQRIILREMA